ncbi:MAG: hypothetical protein J0L61_05475 [Planctomycetes bacterium]|nr:hypothetical protein [Planctomycetota bacterium]
MRNNLTRLLGVSALLAASASAIGDVGPIVPGVLSCQPVGVPPELAFECPPGHRCCSMPVFDIQGNLQQFATTCCVEGSTCNSQRVGDKFIVFCAFWNDPGQE